MKIRTIFKNRIYIIEEDLEDIGAYLYIFEKNKCVSDFLQDNLEACKEYAFEEFNIPINSWKEI